MKTDEQKYQEFLNKYIPNSERLRKVGINPFGYDPGYITTIDGMTVDIPSILAEIISDLVKKAYPETVDDKKMIKEYKKRQKKLSKKIEREKNNEKRITKKTF